MAQSEMSVVAEMILPVLLLALMAPQPTRGMAFLNDAAYKCQRSSPQLDGCIKDGLTRIIKNLKHGNEELGVPSLDAIEVPYLQVRHDDTNLTVDLIMKNILIHGFTDITLARVVTNLDLDDVNKLEVTGRTPALYISGEYVSEGLIVTFPLHSAGAFSINMTEVMSSWVVYLRELTSKQIKYLQIDGFDVDMMPINISFKPAEQLDGDNHLGEAVNVILNENSHEIYSIIKTKIASVFSGVLTEMTNQALRQVPESVYLTP